MNNLSEHKDRGMLTAPTSGDLTYAAPLKLAAKGTYTVKVVVFDGAGNTVSKEVWVTR